MDERGFDGRRVVALEGRRPDEMLRLLEEHGADPLVAPALAEEPVTDVAPVLEFGDELLSGQVNVLVALSGVGVRRLVETLDTRIPRNDLFEALSGVHLVARGAGAVKALHDLGVPPGLVAADPCDWRSIVAAMTEGPAATGVDGLRVVVIESGEPIPALTEALAARGANVSTLALYRWATPPDTGPLRRAVTEIADGGAQVILVTHPKQVEQLVAAGSSAGLGSALLPALARAVVCSRGRDCSEAIRAEGLDVALEASEPTVATLVAEAAAACGRLLEQRVHAVPREQAPNAPWLDAPFLRACRGEPVPYTPVWLMRQAGRYMKEYREVRAAHSFLELCKNPDLVAEVTVYAADRLGVDAAILFADILLIVEPLGLKLEYTRGDGPAISPTVRTGADVDRLREVDPDELDYVYQAVRATRAALDYRIPLIGFCGAPFTLASYVIEGGGSRNYEHTKSLMFRDPGAWHALMERIVRGLIGYCNRQVEAGAQAIQIFDSWVGCLGQQDYREFVLPHSRALIRGITPGVPVIHFGTGTATLLPDMRDAGGDVIGVDWRIELDRAWELIGHNRPVQGNLDPLVLCAEPEYLRMRVKRVLEQAADRDGHIFNLGHGILPHTPVDNVIRLVDWVHALSSTRH